MRYYSAVKALPGECRGALSSHDVLLACAAQPCTTSPSTCSAHTSWQTALTVCWMSSVLAAHIASSIRGSAASSSAARCAASSAKARALSFACDNRQQARRVHCCKADMLIM